MACTFSQASKKRGEKSLVLGSARGPLHGFCASPLQDQMHTFVESEFKMGSLSLKECLHFQNQEKIRKLIQWEGYSAEVELRFHGGL